MKMYETASADELAERLEQALASPRGGESIDALSAFLLRALIADRYPDAAHLYLDWDQSGLSCGDLHDSAGAVIEDFDPSDESYPDCLMSLASNIRRTSDLKEILIGPPNGPFQLKVR
ncbi:hypothetical protein [Mycobacteroides abscessus]|uniref:hypothetical protein n=1 Tax=Mycobacteroides abscessus TaxID=36809 RepID=UPI0013000736|nr:hypothetical protein [Mycobacteroides abscessus]